MSAAFTSTDPGSATGVLTPPTPLHGRHLANHRWERRAGDAIGDLSRTLGSVTTSAVDAFEIAAAIEAYGINDGMARRDFGCADVFDLAEVIFKRTPLHPTSRTFKFEYDPIGRRRLLRGLLFALPGVLFFPLARLVGSDAAAAVFIVVTLIGWIASQGVSSLAHLQGTRVGLSAMRGVLRAALVIGSGAVILGGIFAVIFGVDPTLVVASGAQIIYLLGAIVLLTLDRDQRITKILFPATVAAVALMFLASGIEWLAPSVVVFAALALAAAAIDETADCVWTGVSAADVGRSLTMAFYGFLLGGLIASPIVLLLIDDAPVSLWLGAAALPVTLSMGAAERRFVEFRISNREDLQRTYTTDRYAHQVSRRFVHAISGYALLLVALTGIFLAVGSLFGTPDRHALIIIGAYMVLGIGMYAALIVANSGGASRLSLILLPALAAYVVVGGAWPFLILAGVVSVIFVIFGLVASRHVTAAR